MTIKEKLAMMKAMQDKNRAVDEAFVLGQKSVPAMNDFTTEELIILRRLTAEKWRSFPFVKRGSDYCLKVMELNARISHEIASRQSE